MLYSYKCDNCDKEFEVERYINEDNLGEVDCPICGKIAKRVYKSMNYKTDCNGFFGVNK